MSHRLSLPFHRHLTAIAHVVVMYQDVKHARTVTRLEAVISLNIIP